MESSSSEKHGFPSIKENDPLIDLLLTKKKTLNLKGKEDCFMWL